MISHRGSNVIANKHDKISIIAIFTLRFLQPTTLLSIIT